MFFKFASDHIYPESEWFSVWTVEVFVHALLVDEAHTLAKLNADMLYKTLVQNIKDTFGSEMESIPETWFMDFLREQSPSIHQFLQDTAPDKSTIGRPRERDLMPLPTLDECLRDSESFRNKIQEQG